jgi:hypothetical protein
VQSSTVERMRMAHHRCVGCIGGTRIEQGFQRSGRTIEEERTDGRGCFGHRSRVQRPEGIRSGNTEIPVGKRRSVRQVRERNVFRLPSPGAPLRLRWEGIGYELRAVS